MRRRTVIGLWVLATLWLCLEAGLQAVNRNAASPTEDQLVVVVDHLTAVVAVLGARLVGILLFAGVAWLLQGVIGWIIVVWSLVLAFRFLRDHARRQRELLAAKEAGP